MKDLFSKGCSAVVAVLVLTAAPAVASASHAPSPAAGFNAQSSAPASTASSSAGSNAAASHSGTAKPAPNAQVSCPSQHFSQPFLALHDRHWYTLLPGERVDGFDGAGWTLSGSARFTNVTLKDGKVGQVLALPSGGKAVSPVACVDSAYPQARTIIDTLKGRQGVAVYVSFYEHGSWTRPAATGNVKSAKGPWQASVPIKIHAQSLKAQTPMRFVLQGTGAGSLDQVYDFYLDPRLSW